MKNKFLMLVALLIAVSVLLSSALFVLAESDTDASVTEERPDDVTDSGVPDGGGDGENNSLLSRIVAVVMATLIVAVAAISALRKPRD